MTNTIVRKTLQELLNDDSFKNLNEAGQLAEIAKHLPELVDHQIVSYFPRSSEETEKSLEASLLMDGHTGTIFLSKDFKIVKGCTIYRIIKKLNNNGELIIPNFVFCKDPVATRINECFIHKKYNSNQIVAITILNDRLEVIEEEAKKRMGHKTKGMRKRTTTQEASERYGPCNNYFVLGVRIRKYELKHNKNYLQLVAAGGITLKQVEDSLINSVDPGRVKYIVNGLTEFESTVYDNADFQEDSYNEDDERPKIKKVGAKFIRLSKEYNDEQTKQKKAKEREILAEAKNARELEEIDKKNLANATNADNTVTEAMPTSHPKTESKMPVMTWGKSKWHKTDMSVRRKVTQEQAKQFAIALQKIFFSYDAFSIKFIDNKDVMYLDVPALNVDNQIDTDGNPISDYSIADLKIVNIIEDEFPAEEICEEKIYSGSFKTVNTCIRAKKSNYTQKKVS